MSCLLLLLATLAASGAEPSAGLHPALHGGLSVLAYPADGALRPSVGPALAGTVAWRGVSFGLESALGGGGWRSEGIEVAVWRVEVWGQLGYARALGPHLYFGVAGVFGGLWNHARLRVAGAEGGGWRADLAYGARLTAALFWGAPLGLSLELRGLVAGGRLGLGSALFLVWRPTGSAG